MNVNKGAKKLAPLLISIDHIAFTIFVLYQ